MSTDVVIAVDVGTGSARAGVFECKTGRLLSTFVHELQVWNPQPYHWEQSSEDIWNAICAAVKNSMKIAGLSGKNVRGVAFDATCSLVVLDKEDNPLSVSSTHRNEQNIIMWMDHRAFVEADFANATNAPVLDHVGGALSVEMQIPKLLWLKKFLGEKWATIGGLFDLSDYVSFRATSSRSRSCCTTTCKWTFCEKWSDSFFEQIGLEDLVAEGYERIGGHVVHNVGEAIGCLSETALRDFGLEDAHQPIQVASGLIDAYAGALGSLSICSDGSTQSIQSSMALVSGTSSCHIAVHPECSFVRGVWGPYKDVLFPGLWAVEGGQSAAGKLLDHVVFAHPSYSEAQKAADSRGVSIYTYLNEHIEMLAKRKRLSHSAFLIKDIHVLEDFHGNRSPLADAKMTGMICGLTLDSSVDSLSILYYATVASLAYGTRHIIETMQKEGYKIQKMVMSGGLCNNELFIRTHSDACKLPFLVPRKGGECVLLGTAINAFSAAFGCSLFDAMSTMKPEFGIVQPNEAIGSFHERKFEVHQRLLSDQLNYQSIMENKN